MRTRLVAILGIALFFSNCQSTFAAIIEIHYTGIYSGSWMGNYGPGNPLGDPQGPTSGSLGSGQFSLDLTFDTSRAYPVNVTSSQVSTFSIGFQNNPSAGFASFSGGLGYVISGASFASHQVGEGFTTQQIADFRIDRGGQYTSPILGISAYSEFIPDSIFESFSILGGLSGTGSLTDGYSNTFLGGGRIVYELTPLTLAVQVSGVPEPSTWAMVFLGFACVGCMTYRRRRTAALAA